jgi:hypothetical protein
MQHGKCAFCESRISHTAYGDVEHFRPKAGFKQNEGDVLERPGYYWLVYAWTNLFLACQLCNQMFKKNLFPLRNPTQRALTRNHPLPAEKPLLIDPCDPRRKPERDLTFHDELAVPVRNSRKGKATIDVLGLNRQPLAEQRRERLQRLRMLVECQSLIDKEVRDPNTSPARRLALEPTRMELAAMLEDARRPHAEYSAMWLAYHQRVV